jgi:hypothetical protein
VGEIANIIAGNIKFRLPAGGRPGLAVAASGGSQQPREARARLPAKSRPLINEAATQMASGSEQVDSCARQLSALSDQLKSLMGQFAI